MIISSIKYCTEDKYGGFISSFFLQNFDSILKIAIELYDFEF